jgi:polysaccharide export outer membrane protein
MAMVAFFALIKRSTLPGIFGVFLGGVLTVAGQESSPSVPALGSPLESSRSRQVSEVPERALRFSPIVIPADPATLMESLDDKHLLARRDKVVYVVVEDRDEPRELVISDLGEINVPYLGRVQAEGKTCKALAHEVKAELEKDLYRRATVVISVLELSGKRGTVYLAGEVRSIGPQIIPSDETLTLSKAILRAGGFGDFANQRKVKIIRHADAQPENSTLPAASPGGSASAGGPEADGADELSKGKVITLVVDVKSVLEDGELDRDVVLLPDDFIFVPARWINF